MRWQYGPSLQKDYSLIIDQETAESRGKIITNKVEK